MIGMRSGTSGERSFPACSEVLVSLTSWGISCFRLHVPRIRSFSGASLIFVVLDPFNVVLDSLESWFWIQPTLTPVSIHISTSYHGSAHRQHIL
jgi:hypothetical protein